MTEPYEPNMQYTVQSLVQRNASLMEEVAYKDAIIRDLSEQLENLKKEQVNKMDKEVKKNE